MGMNRQRIVLDKSLRAVMNKETNKRNLEKHYHERLLIILKSASGISNTDISRELSCDYRTVSLWCKRWYDRLNENDITIDENGEKLPDRVLIDRIKDILSDKPRSGCPSRLTEEELIRLQALACESPEDHGLPFSVWTHKTLSEQAKKHGIIISPTHYGIILKKRFTSA